MTRHARTHLLWSLAGLLLALASGYLLAIVHYPTVEAVVLGYLGGCWYAWSAPVVIRWIGRRGR